jgi:hypothetical protein
MNRVRIIDDKETGEAILEVNGFRLRGVTGYTLERGIDKPTLVSFSVIAETAEIHYSDVPRVVDYTKAHDAG